MKVVEDVRRERLQELRVRFGTLAALNRQLGRLDRDATLGQYLNKSVDSRTKKVKGMGSALAREIEEKLNLEVGWMDTDPDLVAGQAPAWPFANLDYGRFERLTAEQRIEIQGVLRERIERFEDESSGGAGTDEGGRDQLRNVG
jgi:hypothetical protein